MEGDQPSLSGIYAFVPLPWDESFELQPSVLRSDIEYLCSTSITGVYAADSTGEFFTLDEDEYRTVVDTTVSVATDADRRVQVNCTSSSERGALDRARYAAKRGVDAIRFAFPYWEDLRVEDALGFLERLDDATGDVPLVHYNNPRASPTFGAEEYHRALSVAPSLVGTKLVGSDPLELVDVIERVPELRHFVGEPEFAAMMAAGADGCYSWIGTMHPELAMEWYEATTDGAWTRAMEIQRAIWQWRLHTFEAWDVSTDAGYNKLDARVNPNYDFHPRVRPPYASGGLDDVAVARSWAREHLPELVAPREGTAGAADPSV